MDCKKNIADENEVLEMLTRILRREETEDNVIKLREETKTAEGGSVVTQRVERTEAISLCPKLSEVIRAAELIGKAKGVFSERIEGAITLPLIICGEEELK